MNFNKIISYKYYFLFFITSKFINFFILGIAPADITGFGYSLLSKELLHNDLLKSLFYMHIQPPLYNFIVGLGLKIFDANLYNLKFFLFFFNLILSFFIIILSLKIAKILNFNNKYQTFLFFFFLFNPSLIYFENHLGYMHISNFLMVFLTYLIIKYFFNNSIIYLNLIFLAILSLTLIYSLFHPVVILMVYFLINLLNKSYKKNFFFIYLFVFLSFLNPIKNLFIFSFFTNSSFLGFNLSTTLYPAFTNQSFSDFKIDCDMDKYLGGYYNLNNPEIHQSLGSNISNSNNIINLVKSKECMKKSLNLIINNPKDYLYGRFLAFLASSSKFSFEKDNYQINDRYGIFSIFDNLNEYNLKFYKQFIIFIFNIFVNFYLIIYLIKNKSFIRNSILIIYILYLFMFVIAHLVNGYEHARIMYSMFTIYIIFWILFFKNKFNFFYKDN